MKLIRLLSLRDAMFPLAVHISIVVLDYAMREDTG